MTTEELKAQLAELQESIAKLETTNLALKDENKSFSTKVREAKEAAEAAEAAREAAAAEAERASGDVTAIEKRLNDAHKKALDKLNADLAARDTELRTIKVDNEITRALSEGKVLDHMLEPLSYQFKAKATYENGVANIDGQPIGEYIGTFLGSELGENFRRGSNTSGANSAGNTSTAIIKDHGFTRENFSSKTGEWAVLSKTDPATAKQAAIESGRPDLAATL